MMLQKPILQQNCLGVTYKYIKIVTSVTRLADFLDFGQLFKAFVNN